MRRKLQLTQIEMAKKLGLKQSVVSRLEDVDRGNVNVTTLLNVAKRLDVGLVIQFVDYPEFLERTRDLSEHALQPATIRESVERLSSTTQASAAPASYTLQVSRVSTRTTKAGVTFIPRSTIPGSSFYLDSLPRSGGGLELQFVDQGIGA